MTEKVKNQIVLSGVRLVDPKLIRNPGWHKDHANVKWMALGWAIGGALCLR